MQDEREELINRLLEASRGFHHAAIRLGADRELAEIDLTMPQLKVLFVVAASKGVTMTNLARTLAMTLSTATGIADRLIDQGLVRREDDPSDRRLVLLHATDVGIALVDRLAQIGVAHFRLIAERLSIDELRLLVQAQELVLRAMSEISEVTVQ